MNAGMFGMPSARSTGARKVVASAVGRASTAVVGATAAIGASSSVVGMTLGVRQRMLSISGGGALRATAINQATGGAQSLRLEVWVDGVAVADVSNASVASGSGLIAVGFAVASGTPLWDWIPFDSSLEIWATMGASAGLSFGAVYDIHQ